MATTEVKQLRQAINEPANVEPYTDEYLLELIQLDGGVNPAAVRVWREKASTYAHLVNTSEGGSSRSNGDLYKNAIAMADLYGKAETPAVATASRASRTRRIERA